ncbi:hypothetical protein [Haladaptatus sp.]|uniref:hypothetical protein n=1 Tax=Haladaptatus sp. TaxID=1973141 RepID=UPI003C3A08DE
MKRRTLLASSAGFVVGSTAGCLHVLDSAAARIGNLELINDDTKPHDFHVELKRYETTVAQVTRRVGPSDGKNKSGHSTVSGYWLNPARYTATVRVEDSRADVTVTKDDCNDLIIEYNSGRIGFFTDLTSNGCPSARTDDNQD